MRILFLHDNFPAQFGDFAQFLARSGWDVLYGTQREGVSMSGIRTFQYKPHREPSPEGHPYARSFEKAVINGQGVARALLSLARQGEKPDIVLAHSGWGPGLYVKDIWPDVKYAGYFEWYYQIDGPDLAFLDNSDPTTDALLAGQTRNAAILTDLANCDGAIVPTAFQRSQFPEKFQSALTVMHDGIDTDYYAPPDERRRSVAGIEFDDDAQIITYVARGMEPYRGFPEFMAALSRVMEEKPNVHAVIVGEDRVAYGRKLPGEDSYKKRALADYSYDEKRLHFTGLLPRGKYRAVLRASDVHVYLTIPFVLSWSMLEAMSTGCAIVASDTAPVREIAAWNDDALTLVDHKNTDALAEAMLATLKNRERAKNQGEKARDIISHHYARAQLFREKMALIERLVAAP